MPFAAAARRGLSLSSATLRGRSVSSARIAWRSCLPLAVVDVPLPVLFRRPPGVPFIVPSHGFSHYLRQR